LPGVKRDLFKGNIGFVLPLTGRKARKKIKRENLPFEGSPTLLVLLQQKKEEKKNERRRADFF